MVEAAVVVRERGDLALGEATDEVDAEASATVAGAGGGTRCAASSCLTLEAAFLFGPLVEPFGGPRFFG